jgi:hypothetical protein
MHQRYYVDNIFTTLTTIILTGLNWFFKVLYFLLYVLGCGKSTHLGSPPPWLVTAHKVRDREEPLS